MHKKTTQALESYLECIAELEKQYKTVRTTDLAKKMNCSLPSVTGALKRLYEFGLIKYEPYKPVTLTQKGQAAIERLEQYHKVLEEFFLDFLCFSKNFAQKQACKLEHVIPPEILTRLKNYLDFLKIKQLTENEIRKEFIDFYKQNEKDTNL